MLNIFKLCLHGIEALPCQVVDVYFELCMVGVNGLVRVISVALKVGEACMQGMSLWLVSGYGARTGLVLLVGRVWSACELCVFKYMY